MTHRRFDQLLWVILWLATGLSLCLFGLLAALLTQIVRAAW
jgi:hypothetical protein